MKVNFMLLAGGMSQSVEQWSMSNDGMREVVEGGSCTTPTSISCALAVILDNATDIFMSCYTLQLTTVIK